MTARLVVGGRQYDGWKDISITAGLDRMARDFTVGVTHEWKDAEAGPRNIAYGDRVEVFIDNDLVLTGYVDGTPISYDARAVQVSVTGRSLTADLVDCSVLHSTGQIKGKSALGIIADLAGPYGVEVVAAVDVGASIIEHQIEIGETVAESALRIASLRQLLLTDDARGRLVLTRAGSERASSGLVLGENVLAASTSLDGRDRFSEYRVLGQRSGNDLDYAATVAGQKGVATDRGVPRKRVSIGQATGQPTLASLRDQARWQAGYNAGQTYATTYTVQGWRQADGSLWRPNQIVAVKDPIIGFNVDMLIGEVTYSLSENGTTATLNVAPRAAWELAPKLPDASGRQGQSAIAKDNWIWREPSK